MTSRALRIFATSRPSGIGAPVLPMTFEDAEINRLWAPKAKEALRREREG